MKSEILPQKEDLIYIEDIIDIKRNKASKNVIYSWIREKRFPALKVGKRYVFSRKRVPDYPKTWNVIEFCNYYS